MILERKVLPSIREQIQDRWDLDVEFSPHVIDQLLESATSDVQSGGRGIGNLVEAAILNPLSRVTFELMVQERQLAGQRLEINKILPPDDLNGQRYELNWELCSEA